MYLYLTDFMICLVTYVAETGLLHLMHREVIIVWEV
jgi:hypothetical protein